MQRNDAGIRAFGIYRKGDTVVRVLDVDEEKGMALVVDCMKTKLPFWMQNISLQEAEEISEDALADCTGRHLPEAVGTEENCVMHERYRLIAGVLPFVGDKKKRSCRMKEAAERNGVSINTLKSALHLFLVFQDIRVLAPKERQEEKELTRDEKNMRWALNKFYYSRAKRSISTAYTLLLKEKYCDGEGKLREAYPSIHQFRYFYRKNRKLQTYYISRDGLKDYQRNHRPLLGDGVQEFAPAVGTAMMDATVCDIYLVDDAGHLVGRPILVACVDAFSSLCYGYSLLWEGGVYSLRTLLLNVVADKREWCERFGILAGDGEWDSQCLPGRMITDMGTEYTSGTFEQITELGVELVNLPSYRPELKGPVEKFFDLVQGEYKKHLKGKGVIEPDYRERGAHDYRKDACLTMRDFEAVILRCILYYNSHRVVEGFPYTEEMLRQKVKPYASAIFAWGKGQPGAHLLSVTGERLVQALLPRTEGRFTRYGLKANGLRYHAEGYTEEYLKGGAATVAYNPDDVGSIWLVKDGVYHVFELIEKRFCRKSLEETLSFKEACKENIKQEAEKQLQAKIDLAAHIQGISERAGKHADTKIRNIRQTRRKEQRKCHVDVVKEAGNE